MTTTHPIREGQRYNRIVLAVFAVGIVGFFVGMLIDRTFVGVAVYAVACLSGIAALLYLQFVSSVRLADEREQRLHERASGAVVMIVAYAGLPVIVCLYLLETGGSYSIPPVVWGGIFTLSGVYLLWGAAYAVAQRRT